MSTEERYQIFIEASMARARGDGRISEVLRRWGIRRRPPRREETKEYLRKCSTQYQVVTGKRGLYDSVESRIGIDRKREDSGDGTGVRKSGSG